MVNGYRRKIFRKYRLSHLLMVAKHTKICNCSIREASKLYCVPYSTLRRCCQRSEIISFDTSIRKSGRSSVFSRAQKTELLMVICLTTRSLKQILRTVYEHIQTWRVAVLPNWKRSKAAGIDWLRFFLKMYLVAGLYIKKRKQFYTNKSRCVGCNLIVPMKMITNVCCQCWWAVCVDCTHEHGSASDDSFGSI